MTTSRRSRTIWSRRRENGGAGSMTESARTGRTGTIGGETIAGRPSHGADDLAALLERHRPELTGYCYRMLGSAFEAEDAVQETLVRAWRGYGQFEGRAALRTWLFRIANNVCLDMLDGAQRRARPMDLSTAGTADSPLGD